MPKLYLILDPGHGVETAGKRSPVWEDGSQLFEFEFNRAIVARVASKLKETGIKFSITCPTDHVLDENISADLVKRVEVANKIQKKQPTLFLSFHGNASGLPNGPARGFEFFTSKGQTASDRYATIIADELREEFPSSKFRGDYTDGDIDKEDNLWVTGHTNGAAVLMELLFFDNPDDCRIMLSDSGRDKIANAIFNAIKRIIAS